MIDRHCIEWQALPGQSVAEENQAIPGFPILSGTLASIHKPNAVIDQNICYSAW
ncbi:MAG: hypothetical protein XXXJIFNMEKO3_03461 [Candidatus Erwinia impunctatus]|nr:hypothetical protein XXXJIFNMEKO_03461 [Culicoides impunctatus]